MKFFLGSRFRAKILSLDFCHLVCATGSKWLCFWTFTALIIFSWFIWRKIESITATFLEFKWWFRLDTCCLATESTFHSMLRFIPFVLVESQIFGQFLIAFTNIAFAAPSLICAFDNFCAIWFHDEIEFITQIFSFAATIILRYIWNIPFSSLFFRKKYLQSGDFGVFLGSPCPSACSSKRHL